MGYPTVLVLDGNSRAALAATRSLGRLSCRVITAADRHPSLSSCSRFSSGWFLYPDPYSESGAFLEKVLQASKTCRADILMPMAELSTILISQNKKRFEECCRVPFPSCGPVYRAADKGHVIALARSLGIPVPATRVLDSPPGPDEVEGLLRTAAWPVVAKPSRSCVPSGGGWRKTRVRYADSKSELKSVLESAAAHNEFPLLLQEKITGEGVGVFLLIAGGRPLAVFSHRRIREKPPSGGVSVLRESIAPDPELVDQSVRLLGELGWNGVAMVEFKRDDKSGLCRLMEVNGRFWGSLQLAINAGVDFPLLLAKSAMGVRVQPVMNYKTGVRLRWLWGDVDSLLSVLSSGPAKEPGRGHCAGRMEAVLDFLKFGGKDTRYEVYDREDIRPWLHETREWLLGKS